MPSADMPVWCPEMCLGRGVDSAIPTLMASFVCSIMHMGWLQKYWLMLALVGAFNDHNQEISPALTAINVLDAGG